MFFAPIGSLRQNLDENFHDLTWRDKLSNLYYIAGGLVSIHDKGLIHRDFHSGNILSNLINSTRITDLGLCKPANEKSEKSEKCIYGVLPHIAPEVLRVTSFSLF